MRSSSRPPTGIPSCLPASCARRHARVADLHEFGLRQFQVGLHRGQGLPEFVVQFAAGRAAHAHRFRPIDPAAARAYWASGEPADKAGGYAIQGRGGAFVERLEGSYSGVVGLPLFETLDLLREAEGMRREEPRASA